MEPATAIKPVPQAQPLPMSQARISGRVDYVRKAKFKEGQRILTLVKLPAPDSYSSPQTIEIRSVERLGSPGDDITCIVAIGGFGRSFDMKDEDSEDSKTVRTATIVLNHVG